MNVAFTAGWWYTYPSEKYELVSGDDEIPNIWKNQPVMFQSPPTRSICIMSII